MNQIAKAEARPIDVLRRQLSSLPEIAQNLPSTMSPEKFRNVDRKCPKRLRLHPI